ncbi:glycosyltransferase family 2 protein [Spirosoma koreense]
MSVSPTISVVMPVYNGERFLAEAIESILTQTFTDFELILVNDGSTDSSAAIIAQYADQDRRVQVATNPVAQGFGGEKASNAAYRLARGRYIAKLDADDVAHPQRLEKQFHFLETNPDIFLVGSWLTIIDDTGKVVGKRQYPIEPDAILREFYYRNCIGHPSIMFRNGVLTDEFYQLRFKALNDYYSHFVHLQQGLKMANLPEYLVRYRIHDDNTTFSVIKRQWRINMEIKQSFVHDFDYHPPWLHRSSLSIITLLIENLPETWLNKLVRLRSRYNL